MDLQRYKDSPVATVISFHKLIEHLEAVAATGTGLSAQRAQQLLALTAPYPVLREGTTDPLELAQLSDILAELLAELFPSLLSNNEIKAVTVPFQHVLLHPSARLQRILHAAGPAFDMVIRNFNDHQFYVNTCCLILNQFYGTDFNFGRPLLYAIPNAQGIIKHYRILYNTDFIELSPTDKAVKIKPEDIELLRDSFDDLDIWKKFFPAGSWLFKGFAIMNLFDTTVEHAVSALKGSLLGATNSQDLRQEIQKVFRSIYKISDLKVGFTSYNEAENKFGLATFNSQLNSYLLKDGEEQACAELSRLMRQDKYLVISDLDKLLQKEPENGMARLLITQDIQSVILAPVIKNGLPLGVLELASSKAGDLNSINATQLEILMPYITDTIDRQHSYKQNQVQALIQSEYTTIHPSVYWKFRKEAQNAIDARSSKKQYTLKEINFPDVRPLYGQVDIKGSSTQRNVSIQLKKALPFPLDVTSLILVCNHPMTIQFRMDEKRFDVDGSGNARFEILKKRVDKACIKNTTERLTAVGKIVIVYTSYEEEAEYLEYIHFLQGKQLLQTQIELVDVEDLQGVSGLKAIRVSVQHSHCTQLPFMYSYTEMTADQLSIYDFSPAAPVKN